MLIAHGQAHNKADNTESHLQLLIIVSAKCNIVTDGVVDNPSLQNDFIMLGNQIYGYRHSGLVIAFVAIPSTNANIY